MTWGAILLACVDCCLGFFSISVKPFGKDMVSSWEMLKQTKDLIEVKYIWVETSEHCLRICCLLITRESAGVFLYFWNELENCSKNTLHILGATVEEVSNVWICLLFSFSLLMPLYVQGLIRTGLVILHEYWFRFSERDVKKLLHCMEWNKHFQSRNPLTP